MQEQLQNNLEKGLNLNLQPEFQPEGTYRFALNAYKSMQPVGLLNEEGNELCIDLDGYEILGNNLLLHTNNFIIFLKKGLFSRILLFNTETCTSEILYEDNCLNFNNPINSVVKVLDYCNETIVYFTDGENPIRYINITKQLKEGYIQSCKDLDLFGCISPIEVLVKSINTPGKLYTGVYQFVARYEDSNWFSITNPIPIYDEVFTSSWRQIDGGEDIVCAKQIQLELNQVIKDKKINIAVIKTISGVISAEIIYSGTATNFIYDGSAGIAVTIDSIIVPNMKFLTAELLSEYQNKLLLSNIKETKNVDYQQIANGIEVRWFTSRLSVDKGETAYKNPFMYEYLSFMGDEIYALGIVLEFCDGTYSKVFHIPGTEKSKVDACFNPITTKLTDGTSITYTSISDLVPIEDPNNFFECEKEVWEIYDTACVVQSPHTDSEYEIDCGIVKNFNPGIWQIGTLGYNEQCETYPNTKNCNGEFLYGDLAGKPVRHHRMPSRRLVPHFENDVFYDTECPVSKINEGVKKPFEDKIIFPIGIRIDNILPPKEKELTVKNYHIVMAERTEATKTVIAKGMLINTFVTSTETEGICVHPKYNINGGLSIYRTLSAYSYPTLSSLVPIQFVDYTRIYKFHSPNTHFSKPYLGLTHFKVEQQWQGTGRAYGNGEEDFNEVMMCNGAYNFNMANHSPNFQVNRKINIASYINANSVLKGNFSRTILNLHQESGVVFEIPQTSLKLEFENPCRHEFTDKSLFQYISGADNCFENKENCAQAIYGSLISYNCNQYGSLEDIQYIKLKYNESVISADDLGMYCFGDSFINFWGHVRTALCPIMNNNGFATEFPAGDIPNKCFESGNDLDLALKTVLPLNCLFSSVYESDINVDLRHSGLTETYYPKLIDKYLHSSIPGYAFPENSFLNRFRFDTDTDSLIGVGMDNIRDYNKDYSRQNIIRKFFAMPNNYNTCDCVTESNNRIYISDTDNYENEFDSWKIFRYQNYVNLPSQYGNIKNIFNISNNLYAHTEHNLFKIYTSEDKLLSDTKQVYIGSGSIFSSTPQYIFASDEGYAGLNQLNGTLINQFGYFWADTITGNIYSFDGQSPKNMLAGLYSWLLENNKSFIKKDFPNSTDTYWHFGFDHKNMRLLYTKIDYKVKEEFKNKINFQDGKYYYNGTEIKLTDETYFCNMSFTLSYSYLIETPNWVSWHSYTPDKYLMLRDKFFSVADDIYKHGSMNKQTYYGTYYPHIIEYVVSKNGLETILFDAIQYYQTAEKLLTTGLNKLYEDITFNSVFVYNSKQNTGIQTMGIKTDFSGYMNVAVKNIKDFIFVNKKESKWFLNQFTDNVTNYLTTSNVCECLFPHSLTPNKVALSYKPFYKQQYLRDLYHAVRFTYFYPKDATINLNTKYFLTSISNSIR